MYTYEYGFFFLFIIRFLLSLETGKSHVCHVSYHEQTGRKRAPQQLVEAPSEFRTETVD